MAQTPYELLGLKENCSFEDIKHHYRMMAKKFHPDINQTPGSKKMFEAIKAAYEFLMQNHVESIGVQAAKTIRDMVFATKMARAAAKQKAQGKQKPKGVHKMGIKEKSLVGALKRWSS